MQDSTPSQAFLKGKVILATGEWPGHPGGVSEASYSIAEGLVTDGAKVYVGGRKKGALIKVAQELYQHNLTRFRWTNNRRPIEMSLNSRGIMVDAVNRNSIIVAREVIEDANDMLYILVNSYAPCLIAVIQNITRTESGPHCSSVASSIAGIGGR